MLAHVGQIPRMMVIRKRRLQIQNTLDPKADWPIIGQVTEPEKH